MDKKWRKSIFQLLPLDGQYFLTIALNDWSLGKQLILFAENLNVFLGGVSQKTKLTASWGTSLWVFHIYPASVNCTHLHVIRSWKFINPCCNSGHCSTFAGNSALLPFDVIDFAMLPAHRFWQETVSLLDVMWIRSNQWECELLGKKISAV